MGQRTVLGRLLLVLHKCEDCIEAVTSPVQRRVYAFLGASCCDSSQIVVCYLLVNKIICIQMDSFPLYVVTLIETIGGNAFIAYGA